MATIDEIKIEVELRMYQIRNTNKKWYEFWKSKTKRVLMSSDFNNEDEVLNEITKTKEGVEHGKKESEEKSKSECSEEKTQG